MMKGVAVLVAVALGGMAEAILLDTRAGPVSPSGPLSNDDFGQAVAVYNDVAVIGAQFGGFSESGEAYVFTKSESGSGWSQLKQLQLGVSIPFARFGTSVCIWEDTIVVGANEYDDFEESYGDGFAIIFQKDQGGLNNWGFVKGINGPSEGGGFGNSCDLKGDTLVIAAPGQGRTGNGAVYVYERNRGGANNWGLRKRIKPNTNKEVGMGFSVTMSDDESMIFASTTPDEELTGFSFLFGRNKGGKNNWGQLERFKEEEMGSGIGWDNAFAPSLNTVAIGFADGTSLNGDLEFSGFVHIYDRTPNGGWELAQVLEGSNKQFDHYFGESLEFVDDNTLLVGAAGAGNTLYVFTKDASGVWTETTKDTLPFDAQFGISMGYSNGTIIVGAPVAVQSGFELGTAYFYDIATDEGDDGSTSAPTTVAPSGCSKDILLAIDRSHSINERETKALSKVATAVLQEFLEDVPGGPKGYVNRISSETVEVIGFRDPGADSFASARDGALQVLSAGSTRSFTDFRGMFRFRDRVGVNIGALGGVVVLLSDGFPVTEENSEKFSNRRKRVAADIADHCALVGLWKSVYPDAKILCFQPQKSSAVNPFFRCACDGVWKQSAKNTAEDIADRMRKFACEEDIVPQQQPCSGNSRGACNKIRRNNLGLAKSPDTPGDDNFVRHCTFKQKECVVRSRFQDLYAP